MIHNAIRTMLLGASCLLLHAPLATAQRLQPVGLVSLTVAPTTPLSFAPNETHYAHRTVATLIGVVAGGALGVLAVQIHAATSHNCSDCGYSIARSSYYTGGIIGAVSLGAFSWWAADVLERRTE